MTPFYVITDIQRRQFIKGTVQNFQLRKELKPFQVFDVFVAKAENLYLGDFTLAEDAVFIRIQMLTDVGLKIPVRESSVVDRHFRQRGGDGKDQQQETEQQTGFFIAKSP